MTKIGGKESFNEDKAKVRRHIRGQGFPFGPIFGLFPTMKSHDSGETSNDVFQGTFLALLPTVFFIWHVVRC